MDNKKPQITLAICTCNRTELLTKLLESIQVSKPCDIANIEVLVVDNHKSHNAINVVQNMSDFKYSLHYISEERAGVPYARNTACDWCVSRSGEAIIFVDDDEVVDEYWLVKLITYYLQRKDEVSIIAGPVYAYFSRPLSKYVPDDLYRKKRSHLKTGASMKSAATNNVIFDIAVYQSRGIRFDESMPFCGGTDNMFFRQAVKEGYKIEWLKEAVCWEYFDNNRMSLLWLLRRYYRYGVSHIRITDRLHDRHRVAGLFRIHLRALMKIYVNTLKKIFTNNYRYSMVYLLVGITKSFGIVGGLLGLYTHEYKSYHD